MSSLRYISLLSFIMVSTGAAQESISCREAIDRTIKADNRLQALELEHKAADEMVNQAGLSPNPEAEVELENLGISGLEIMLTQPIELGGKKQSRVATARKKADLSRLEYEQRKISLTAEIYRRCILVLANREHGALLDSALTRAESTIELLRERAEAGAVSNVDITRAELEAENIRMEILAVNRQDARLRQSLASMWGEPDSNPEAITGKLNESVSLPDPEQLAKALTSHPEIQAAALSGELARARLQQVKSEAVPDLEISGGYARNNDLKENSFILSAGIPLPLFNRGQGATAGQEHQIHAQDKKQAGIRLLKKRDLNWTISEIRAIDDQLELLTNTIFPKTGEVFYQLQEFYSLGKVSLLEILEAQDELLEVRSRMLGLMTERALLHSDLIDLTGIETEMISE